MLSLSEENHLKVIFHLSNFGKVTVNTNAIADALQTKPASVTDMLKKMAEKELLHYTRYQGVSLTEYGMTKAKQIIRKHRLWEVFLVEKLGISWDQVHQIAEQLEHIHSELLIQKLDEFLGHPEFDPHGEPIPTAKGIFSPIACTPLINLEAPAKSKIMAVKDNESNTLRHFSQLGLGLDMPIEVIAKKTEEAVMTVFIPNQNIKIDISFHMCEQIWVAHA